MQHDDLYHKENMLTRGQEITEEVDESKAVLMPLEAGQMSIHNYRIAHASGDRTWVVPETRMRFVPPTQGHCTYFGRHRYLKNVAQNQLSSAKHQANKT